MRSLEENKLKCHSFRDLSRYAALRVRPGLSPGGRTLRGKGTEDGSERGDSQASGLALPDGPSVFFCLLFPGRKSLLLPRKEVIQPHVPVRLPGYDFTPLTLHTFGASLTGLGRRLRVQTTRVA